jgi:uracil-DNA glycosylase
MNNYKIENLLSGVKDSWKNIILNESKKNYFKAILTKIYNSNKPVYPLPEHVFETFKYFDINETKIVLLGQDPYHGFEIHDEIKVPQAIGLSFAVSKFVNIPPSLVNIYKELSNEIPNFKIPEHGDLLRWVVEEKILLLNSALTVVEKTPGSHLKDWEKFTDMIIEKISDESEFTIFILLIMTNIVLSQVYIHHH